VHQTTTASAFGIRKKKSHTHKQPKNRRPKPKLVCLRSEEFVLCFDVHTRVWSWTWADIDIDAATTINSSTTNSKHISSSQAPAPAHEQSTLGPSSSSSQSATQTDSQHPLAQARTGVDVKNPRNTLKCSNASRSSEQPHLAKFTASVNVKEPDAPGLSQLIVRTNVQAGAPRFNKSSSLLASNRNRR